MKYVSLFLLLGMLATACSEDNFTSVEDQSPATADDAPCVAGQTRCVNRTHQRCVMGEFVDIETCGGDKVCAAKLGCADCDPEANNACHNNDVYRCQPNGTIGPLVEKCITEPCRGGVCGSALCSPESQLIYVVDRDNQLLSFSPANGANTFSPIKKLTCPAGASLRGDGKGTPFSMAVDRGARAWVLYTSGEIFWVDTRTGECQPSSYEKRQQGFELFGMGFVVDAPEATSEKLYITGGTAAQLVPANFGLIDPQTLQVTKLGTVEVADQSPELTGTGKAALYGYFPGMKNTFVAEINKQTGQTKQKWSLPGLSGDTVAWAFAHWGGKFYIFVSVMSGAFSEVSQVLRLNPADGQVQTVLNNIPYRIVGAGVSTCAPTIE